MQLTVETCSAYLNHNALTHKLYVGRNFFLHGNNVCDLVFDDMIAWLCVVWPGSVCHSPALLWAAQPSLLHSKLCPHGILTLTNCHSSSHHVITTKLLYTTQTQLPAIGFTISSYQLRLGFQQLFHFCKKQLSICGGHWAPFRGLNYFGGHKIHDFLCFKIERDDYSWCL